MSAAVWPLRGQADLQTLTRMSRPGRVDYGAGATALVLPSINAQLVRRLIAAQFPQWADLPVTPVPLDGWDNRPSDSATR